MFLSDVCIDNKKFLKCSTSGIDSYRNCLNKKHYQSFPYLVKYEYNSRGFRDKEWPNNLDELKESIWCIGDSFTVGLGSPINHTWVWMLEKKINKNCVNISLDGASNFWIARMANIILSSVAPKVLIVHWSYSQRIEYTREFRGGYVQKHFDNLDYNQCLENFTKCFQSVELNKKSTKIIHSFIPHWHIKDPYKIQNYWDIVKGSNWPLCFPKTYKDYCNLAQFMKLELEKMDMGENLFKLYYSLTSGLYNIIKEFEQLDYARDYHHYDYETADYFSNLLIEKLS